jgi:hypothetical protein
MIVFNRETDGRRSYKKPQITIDTETGRIRINRPAYEHLGFPKEVEVVVPDHETIFIAPAKNEEGYKVSKSNNGFVFNSASFAKWYEKLIGSTRRTLIVDVAFTADNETNQLTLLGVKNKHT